MRPTTSNHNAIVQAISGGMDSTSLALLNLRNGSDLHLLSFSYGQKHHLELKRLDGFLALLSRKGLEVSHSRVEVGLGQIVTSSLTTAGIDSPEGYYEEESMRDTVVPNRNMVFFSLLAAKAVSLLQEGRSSVGISLGVHSGDHAVYPDCREEFFRPALEAVKTGNWGADGLSCFLPFLEMDKAGILGVALECCEDLGLDFDEVFSLTSTSYSPSEDGLASGKTGADVERILAFHAIGRVDPVPYADGWEASLTRALDYQKGFQLSRANCQP